MKSDRSTIKPWIVKTRSWIAILIIAPFAIATALSSPSVSEGSLTEFSLGVAGWICFSIGALFRWWATLYVGGKKQRELTINGPYSVCRNPLYLGSFLLALSIAFFLPSLTFAIGLLLATPIYLSVTVSWEEAKLREVFGEKYEQYRSRVPKFIPKLTLFDSPSTVPVNLRGMWAEFRNSLYWLWIPVLAEAAAHLRTKALWSDVLLLP